MSAPTERKGNSMDRLDKWDEKLQSEVETFNLDKPMMLSAFLELPEHAQKEYIQKLRRSYRCKVGEIAEMMGCEKSTVAGILERFGLPVTDKGVWRNPAQTDKWRLFLGTWGEAFDFGRGLQAPKEEEPASVSLAADTIPQGGRQEGTAPSAIDAVEKTDFSASPSQQSKSFRAASVEMTGETAGAQRSEEDEIVTARLRSFVVDLCGPLEAVIRRIEAFRDTIGDMLVRITVRVDEED